MVRRPGFKPQDPFQKDAEMAADRTVPIGTCNPQGPWTRPAPGPRPGPAQLHRAAGCQWVPCRPCPRGQERRGRSPASLLGQDDRPGGQGGQGEGGGQRPWQGRELAEWGAPALAGGSGRQTQWSSRLLRQDCRARVQPPRGRGGDRGPGRPALSRPSWPPRVRREALRTLGCGDRHRGLRRPPEASGAGGGLGALSGTSERSFLSGAPAPWCR